MDLLQAMYDRHSVRSYTERPIEGKTKEEQAQIDKTIRMTSSIFQKHMS